MANTGVKELTHPSGVTLARDDVFAGGLAGRIMMVGLIFGILGMVMAVVLGNRNHDHWDAFLFSYLANFTYFLSLSLGALFFVLVQHLARVGWSVVVRRIAEAVAHNLVVMLFLAVPIVLGMHQLYHWSHEDAVASDPILSGKAVFLNPTFFVVRLALYFIVWIGLSRYFYSLSVLQDKTGAVALTRRMGRASAPAMILYALTSTFASFDLLMSLDPHWFSTMFGVYFFAGGSMGIHAILIISVRLAQASGKLTTVVTKEHYHDLGKLMFVFMVFWTYVAFSQYMLIWYANIPEETEWFRPRSTGEWGTASVCFLIFGHFIAPFVLFMSRWVKRFRNALTVAAIWMLGVHWFDHYWLVMPTHSQTGVPFGVMDVSLFLGIGGLWLAGAAWSLVRVPLVPIGDPRLQESLEFENF